MSDDFKIERIFPCPVYVARRDSILDSTEEKEIIDIIEKDTNRENGTSNNHYIFNTKLKKIREFCEQHIKIYVKEVLNPVEELDFYITQSWLNVIEPGGNIHRHLHSNSIISGTFYVSTVENDSIRFIDPIGSLKSRIEFKTIEYNVWNSTNWGYNVTPHDLLLFPSWLEHNVNPNPDATTTRISIAFNVFAKGNFGTKDTLNELIL